MLYTMYIMNTTLSATEARNRFFELLDLAKYKNQSFTIEKDGEVVATVNPAMPKRTPEEIDKILADVRKVYAKSKKRKYWSVIETPAWKKKEARYVERLSKGIID